MPRDYKRRASSSQRRRNPAPAWVWFLSGLLVGLFFSGLVWIKLLPPAEQTPQARAIVPGKPQRAKSPEEVEERSAPPRPRFDFYTILPEMEVVVPEPEREAPVTITPPPVRTARHEVQQARQAPAAGEVYMLQMGSFRSYSDADRLKASLALVGIEAEIQKVRINGGDTFHRVRSGPFNREQVNQLRGRLKQNKISSLVIKLKQ